MKLVISGNAKRAARRAAMSLRPGQFFTGLYREGFISAEEAVAAARTGAMPTALLTAIDKFKPADKVDAAIAWACMDSVSRNDPLVALLAGQLGKNDAQIDQLFDASGRPKPPKQPSKKPENGKPANG